MKESTPGSNRSMRRKSRGFVSLSQSCRKHRRAAKRSLIARSLGGNLYKAGDKAEIRCGTKLWAHTAGGSVKFW